LFCLLFLFLSFSVPFTILFIYISRRRFFKLVFFLRNLSSPLNSIPPFIFSLSLVFNLFLHPILLPIFSDHKAGLCPCLHHGLL
jgi:hypothetical protein